mmetsp:Transcript_14279/g.35370  ORF Transcript_14279/g.35370 Transcript_14279/m.35370 type:complete len:206 (+) Transcript_14279:387-1004(+)
MFASDAATRAHRSGAPSREHVPSAASGCRACSGARHVCRQSMSDVERTSLSEMVKSSSPMRTARRTAAAAHASDAHAHRSRAQASAAERLGPCSTAARSVKVAAAVSRVYALAPWKLGLASHDHACLLSVTGTTSIWRAASYSSALWSSSTPQREPGPPSSTEASTRGALKSEMSKRASLTPRSLPLSSPALPMPRSAPSPTGCR